MRVMLALAVLLVPVASATAQQPFAGVHEGLNVTRLKDQVVIRFSFPGRGEGRFAVLACSPKDNRIAVELGPGLLAVWDPERDLIPVFLEVGPKGATAVAFSADGARVATTDANKLCVWNAKTGDKVKEFKVTPTDVKGLAFTPDGKSVIIGNSRLQSVNVESGAVTALNRTSLSGITRLALSPDGKTLVVGAGKKLHWLDPKTGQEQQFEDSPNTTTGALAFSVDGRWLASGGEDRQIVVWDANTRKAVKTLPNTHVAAVSALAFTADGKRLLSGNGPYKGTSVAGVETGYTSDIKVWDIAKGVAIDAFVGHGPFGIQAIGVTADGRTAVTAGSGNNRTLHLWDLASVDAPPPPFGAGKTRVRALDVSRDGQWLITHPGQKQFLIWDARTGKLLRQFEADVSVHKFVISADKKSLYGPSLRTSLVKIDVETGKTQTLLQTGDIVPGGIALSPDGRLFAAGGSGNKVRLIDVKTDAVVSTLAVGNSQVHSVAFAPGSDQLAGSSGNPVVRLWDTATGEVIKDVNLPETANVVTLSPDGKAILAGFNGPIRLYDVKSGEELRSYDIPPAPVRAFSLAYSPDGKRILVGRDNLVLRGRRQVVDSLVLLDAASGRVLGRWKTEPGPVRHIRFSGDGRQAFYLSGGVLGVVQVEDTP